MDLKEQIITQYLTQGGFSPNKHSSISAGRYVSDRQYVSKGMWHLGI